MLLMENRVDCTPAFVLDPTAKIVEVSEVVAACIESAAKGELEPMPVSPLPKTVTNGKALDDEAIWKSGVVCVVVACIERLAKGVVVPRPSLPVALSQMNCVPFALPKRTVVEAFSPALSAIVVPVAFTVEPNEVVVVQGKAKFA